MVETRTRRLVRRKGPIAGVCAGVADYFGVDAVLVRIVWVLASFSGPGVLAYIIAWVALPSESELDKDEREARSDSPNQRSVPTILFVILGVTILVGSPWTFRWDHLWFPLLLIGVGVWLLRGDFTFSEMQRRHGPHTWGPPRHHHGHGPWSAPPPPMGGQPHRGRVVVPPPYADGRPAADSRWADQPGSPVTSPPPPPPAPLAADATITGPTAPAAKVDEVDDPDDDRDPLLVAADRIRRDLFEGPHLPADFEPPPPTEEVVRVASTNVKVRRSHGGIVWALTMGTLAIGGGIVWALAAAGTWVPSVAVVLAGALIIVGLGLVVGAFVGRPRGLLGIGILLLCALAMTPVDLEWGSGVGDVTAHPVTYAELQPSYRTGLGDVSVDLSDLKPLKSRHEVEVATGTGDVTLQLPGDIPIVLDVHQGVGDLRYEQLDYDLADADTLVTINGEQQRAWNGEVNEDNWNHDLRVETDRGQRDVLVVNVHTGLGDVRITREPELK